VIAVRTAILSGYFLLHLYMQLDYFIVPLSASRKQNTIKCKSGIKHANT